MNRSQITVFTFPGGHCQGLPSPLFFQGCDDHDCDDRLMMMVMIDWWLIDDYDDILSQWFSNFLSSILSKCLSTRQYRFLPDPGQSMGPHLWVPMSHYYTFKVILTRLWLMKMLTQYKLMMWIEQSKAMWQLELPCGQICNWCKWYHLVENFGN